MRNDTPIKHTGIIVIDITVHLFLFFLSENNYSQIALKPASYFNSSPYINNIWTNTNMISCSSDIQCKKV